MSYQATYHGLIKPGDLLQAIEPFLLGWSTNNSKSVWLERGDFALLLEGRWPYEKPGDSNLKIMCLKTNMIFMKRIIDLEHFKVYSAK